MLNSNPNSSATSQSGITPATLRQLAIGWLAQRDYSRQQLQTKLLNWLKKNLPELFSDPDQISSHEPTDSLEQINSPEPVKSLDQWRSHIDELLADLAERHWQSDQRYAEQFSRSRQRRGIGPLRLRQELYSKGINADDGADAVAKLEVDWLAEARAQAAKKWRQLSGEQRQKCAKLQRFLLYRGYPSDVVQQVVGEYF